VGIAEELEKLTQLHERGALSDQEYAEAKQAILRVATKDTPSDKTNAVVGRDLDGARNGTLGEAANRYVSFQIVMAGISLVIFLVVLFVVFLPQFNRFR
jgi:hypothetical protein